MPTKNLKRLTIYLEPSDFDDLTDYAESDKRTMSQMGAILIGEAIKIRKEKLKREGENV